MSPPFLVMPVHSNDEIQTFYLGEEGLFFMKDKETLERTNDIKSVLDVTGA